MGDAPSIHTVDTLLQKAIKSAASDIHIEPTSYGLRLRYRCDGFLYDVASVLPEYALQVIARIKVLACLDIAEKRVPQDGKFSVMGPQGDIDLRVATFPSLYGEKIVIRILDHAQHIISLDELGLSSEMLGAVRQLINRAHGFFIVTGPTGAGKTTTLYALLASICSSEKNVVTLEDPIEYTIIGTTQGQVNAAIGFDFSRGIRALLRQDPDIIMVGEMRDTETAQTAVQAALTGHLVFSTLHTADAPGTIIRLLDMGIPAFLINAAVTGVLAQRLVRKICLSCKQATPLTLEEEQFCKARDMFIKQQFRGNGCAYCHNTGYRGRMGIFEFLMLTPELRALIHDRMHHDELYQATHQQGMQTMLHDAAAKIEAGLTSVAEIMRVLN